MKEKLLLIAYRAYGDWLYTIPVLPYLFDKYDVYLETNWKIYNLVHNDPRFKHISYFIYEKYAKDSWSKVFPKRWDAVIKKIKPDRILNLNGSLEVKCIGENFQEEFYWELDKRREHFGKLSFYDAVFERCQIKPPKHLKLDELYYSSEEIQIVDAWRVKKKDKFIIILPIAGSTSQKVIHPFKVWTNLLLERYPEAEIYLAGDDICKALVPKDNPRIKNLCGFDIPIKQSFLMTKYADYVLGPETGIVVAAGMWGTPKTMLCTSSSKYQCVKYQKNDYSIQAPMYCSPCHRSIYYDTDCHTMLGDTKSKVVYPACTKIFSIDEIYPRIDKIYKNFREG
jgi:ADP-heptose:LPS heptosyltransferase